MTLGGMPLCDAPPAVRGVVKAGGARFVEDKVASSKRRNAASDITFKAHGLKDRLVEVPRLPLLRAYHE